MIKKISKPASHGHWKDVEISYSSTAVDFFMISARCSACGKLSNLLIEDDKGMIDGEYCPECGAEME